MKKNLLTPLILITSLLLLISPIVFAQDIGKWSTPKAHPCFQGIMVSVINWGQGSGDNDYLWGVKFINNYNSAVSFRYKMNIGEKITSASGGDIATLGMKDDNGDGDTWTLEPDKLRARLFHTPSEEWFVYIWDVCFDKMRCGGSDQCYADCDRDPENPKPNQLCGLSASPSLNAPETNNSPKEMRGTLGVQLPAFDETNNWEREDKQVEIIIGKTKEGIYWKRKNDKQFTFFEKLPSGEYRYETPPDSYTLKFESDTKVGFWKNGTLENYYTLIPKTPADNGGSKVRSGVWIDMGAKATITVTADGLVFHRINSVNDGSPFFKRISEIEYRKYDPDGIHFNTLRLEEDQKLHYTTDANILVGVFVFFSETPAVTDPDKVSAKRLNGTWKSDLDPKVTVTSIATDDDEFVFNYVVAALIRTSGKITYKRESGNVFTNRKKNIAFCFKSVITYISDDRLKILITKCDGSFVKEGEYYRVEK